MKKQILFVVGAVMLAMVLAACGGNGTEKAGQPEATRAEAGQPAQDEGVTVAKAILETFDRAVEEVYALVKDKPDAGTVKADLNALYEKYRLKMGELNVKYLALKEKDIALFGSANGFLGEYRGRHVWQGNQKLDPIRYHYQRLKDEDMDRLVHGDLINLLDLAVKR